MPEDSKIITWTTKLWKIVDHNPGLFVAIFASVLIMSGCVDSLFQGKAVSPVSGQRETADAITNQVNTEINTIDGKIATLISDRAIIDSKILELNSKAESLVELGNEAIDKANEQSIARQEFGKTLLNAAVGLVPGIGPFMPLVLGALGTGVVFDKVRDKKVIKKLKSGG